MTSMPAIQFIILVGAVLFAGLAVAMRELMAALRVCRGGYRDVWLGLAYRRERDSWIAGRNRRQGDMLSRDQSGCADMGVARVVDLPVPIRRGSEDVCLG